MRRMLALAGLFLLLTGCGGADERAPFVESRIPPALGPRFWPPEGWAWGLIGYGDTPVQRYGVSSTFARPTANVLILAGYGESAEAWFETARDLNARGYGVWVLERSGQGGSERYGSPRDRGHVESFVDDVATTRMLARFIRAGSPDTPLVVMGSGVGGLVGLSALGQKTPADGLILSAPDLKPGAMAGWQGWLARARLGGLPSGLNQGWKREQPDDFKAGRTGDRWRGAVRQAWQTANPDLRMGGQSLGWRAAFDESSKATLDDLQRVEAPTLLLAGQKDPEAGEGRQACAALPRCTRFELAGGGPLPHLEQQGVRGVWLGAVETFLAERAKARDAARFPQPGHGL